MSGILVRGVVGAQGIGRVILTNDPPEVDFSLDNARDHAASILEAVAAAERMERDLRPSIEAWEALCGEGVLRGVGEFEMVRRVAERAGVDLSVAWMAMDHLRSWLYGSDEGVPRWEDGETQLRALRVARARLDGEGEA